MEALLIISRGLGKVPSNDKDFEVFNNLNDFVFVFDSNARITNANKALLDVLDYSLEEVINKPLSFMYSQDESSKEIKTTINRILKHELDSHEIPLLTKKGDLIPVETKIVSEKKNNDLTYIGISKNISGLRRAKQALLKEKQFTEAALNAQTDTFFVFEPSTGKAIRWNKAFNEISGYNDEEISKLKAPESYYEENALRDLSKAMDLIKNGGTSINEIHLITKQGDRIPFEYAASGIVDENNRVKYIVAIGRNIEERKKNEQKIIESQEMFRAIIEQSLIGICILQDSKVKFINQKIADELGYPYEEIVNWTLTDLISTLHPEDKEFVAQQAIKKQQGNKDVIQEYMYRLLNKDGQIIWVNNLSRTITYNGRPADLIYQVYITEMKKLEVELRTAEERLRSLIEETTDSVFCYEFREPISIELPIEEQVRRMYDCVLIECNQACAESYGLQVIEDVLGHHLKDVFGTIPHSLDTLFRNLIENNYHVVDGLGVETLPNGEHRYFLNNGHGVIENGKLIRIWGNFRNITERKNSEEKISNLARFPSENPNPILRVNSDKILYVNPSGKRILNIEEGNFLPSFLKSAIDNSLSSLEIQEIEATINDTVYSFVITPIKDTDYANVYGNDITKRKRSEEKIKKSERNFKNAYDRANFYKDLFAHDMNNILHGILASAEIYSLFLNDKEKLEKSSELFEIIKDSANRGAELISNVQKLSAVEDSQLTFKSVNLYATLKDAIQYIKKKNQEKSIEIEVKGFSDNICVQANELLLDVFENIMSNAVMYGEENIVQIQVNIDKITEDKEKFVLVEFIDNGIGIEDLRKTKIFEVGNKEYKGGRGMGIGLSLVKKTIQSYGGDIHVEDKIEGDFSKGSKFVMTIPEYPKYS